MLLKELCQCSGAPGGEEEVRRYIAGALEDTGCSLQTDVLGNVLVHHPGRPGKNKILFTAHMDEPALMIYDITASGALRFKAVGSHIQPGQIAGRTVRVGEDVTGVVGFAPYHMMKITKEQKTASAVHQHIDIGASDRAGASRRVRIGDYAVVDSAFADMGACYKGKAMDSRIGCCALLELLRRSPDREFDVAFTTMYEVGQQGMEVAAYTQRPDLVVSVSAIAAADVPGSTEGEGRVELGQGVCIPLIDAGFAYRRDWVEAWDRLALAAGIPHRMVPYAPDAAPAGFASLCCEQAGALSLLVPCRRPFSPAGVVRKSDLCAVAQMLDLVVEKG